MTKEQYLSALKHHFEQKDPIPKDHHMLLKAFNGVDDLYDNCAGVQLFADKFNVVTGVQIVELEINVELEGNKDYLTVAQEVAEEFLAYLHEKGYTNVGFDNKITRR